MALIEYDAYKQKLRDLRPELDKLSAALDIESACQEAQRLEDETAQDGLLERSGAFSEGADAAQAAAKQNFPGRKSWSLPGRTSRLF